MRQPGRILASSGWIVLLLFAVGVFFVSSRSPAQNEQKADAKTAPEPPPPANQTYIGHKKCASCHFDQYLVWRGDKHAKAFAIMPAKYHTDASCLKCHSTGYGTPTGYKSAADTALAGVTCEVCHGPGSKHAEICKPFAKTKKLSKAQEKLARDSIWRIKPQNICVTCHLAKAHKKHPKYDKQ
jgi:Cytochrome c554 and c-prime